MFILLASLYYCMPVYTTSSFFFVEPACSSNTPRHVPGRYWLIVCPRHAEIVPTMPTWWFTNHVRAAWAPTLLIVLIVVMRTPICIILQSRSSGRCCIGHLLWFPSRAWISSGISSSLSTAVNTGRITRNVCMYKLYVPGKYKHYLYQVYHDTRGSSYNISHPMKWVDTRVHLFLLYEILINGSTTINTTTGTTTAVLGTAWYSSIRYLRSTEYYGSLVMRGTRYRPRNEVNCIDCEQCCKVRCKIPCPRVYNVVKCFSWDDFEREQQELATKSTHSEQQHSRVLHHVCQCRNVGADAWGARELVQRNAFASQNGRCDDNVGGILLFGTFFVRWLPQL